MTGSITLQPTESASITGAGFVFKSKVLNKNNSPFVRGQTVL